MAVMAQQPSESIIHVNKPLIYNCLRGVHKKAYRLYPSEKQTRQISPTN